MSRGKMEGFIVCRYELSEFMGEPIYHDTEYDVYYNLEEILQILNEQDNWENQIRDYIDVRLEKIASDKKRLAWTGNTEDNIVLLTLDAEMAELKLFKNRIEHDLLEMVINEQRND